MAEDGQRLQVILGVRALVGSRGAKAKFFVEIETLYEGLMKMYVRREVHRQMRARVNRED